MFEDLDRWYVRVDIVYNGQTQMNRYNIYSLIVTSKKEKKKDENTSENLDCF